MGRSSHAATMRALPERPFATDARDARTPTADALTDLAYDLARVGQWTRAAEVFWQAAQECVEPEDGWRLAGRSVSAAVHAGDLTLAQSILRGAYQLPRPAFPAHVAAGAAMVSLLVDGDAPTAEHTIQTAISALDPLVDPDEVNQLLVALHVVALCRGASEWPVISSDRALETFDALGATAWVRRTRGTLRVVGSSSRTAPDSSDQLTAQESRVAHLAAYGLSNKDIGERLFLSPRTVSGHLYRLFPKLGITSRAGLRDALQRRDEATARVMETG